MEYALDYPIYIRRNQNWPCCILSYLLAFLFSYAFLCNLCNNNHNNNKKPQIQKQQQQKQGRWTNVEQTSVCHLIFLKIFHVKFKIAESCLHQGQTTIS